MLFKIVKFSLLILHFALFSLISAGAPDTLWTRTYGGANRDEGRSVQQTNDGGFIIAGMTNSFGDGDYDVYLIRTDINGDTLWTKTYGGTSNAGATSVRQISDGGFILAGGTNSPISYKYFYLIRTNINGDTLWTKTYGGADDDIVVTAFSAKETIDGGFIIVGEYGSNIYLIKTKANGDTLWTKIWGGNINSAGYSLQQTNDGGFIIAGRTSNINTSFDVYLLRTKANGDTLWTKTYGGNKADIGYSLQQTHDGGFIIAGQTESFGVGQGDVYLIRTTANGDTVWTKTYGSTGYENGYSLDQTNDSGFIIAGMTDCFDSVYGDVYIIRTASNGDTLWTKTIGGDSLDIGRSVQQISDGGFIIAGYTHSFGSGEQDVYLIRLDKETVGIQDENLFNFLKPNNFIVSSSQGNISIRYTITYSTSVKLEAFDIQGRLVEVIQDRFMHKGSHSVKWESQRFGAGVFYIKLTTGNNSLIQKAVILK